jgi:hypothetical protein
MSGRFCDASLSNFSPSLSLLIHMLRSCSFLFSFYYDRNHPDRVGALPDAFNRNLGNGYRPNPGKLLHEPDGAAMLHFQGGSGYKRKIYKTNYYGEGKDLMEFCDRTKICPQRPRFIEQYRETWGLGSYYLRLPWTWAIQNAGIANLRPDDEHGHTFIFETIDGNGMIQRY